MKISWKVDHHPHLSSWKIPLLTKGVLDCDELKDVPIMESSSLRTSFGCSLKNKKQEESLVG
jgi:hypothetical protein